MAKSLDVSWQLDGILMEGTVVRPDGDGPFPAVVLVAGSGPTDRDWCSPLLPGSNGSGRLFADALAGAGIASIRYDKRASGPHAMENVMKLIGTMSMQSHLDELVAAVQVLAGLDDVPLMAADCGIPDRLARDVFIGPIMTDVRRSQQGQLTPANAGMGRTSNRSLWRRRTSVKSRSMGTNRSRTGRARDGFTNPRGNARRVDVCAASVVWVWSAEVK